MIEDYAPFGHMGKEGKLERPDPELFCEPCVSDIIRAMDVYLSRQALLQLEAMSVISDEGEGILYGHKQGHRFFVENVLPAQGVFSSAPERLRRLQDLLQSSFLGFFSLDSGEVKMGDVMGPAFVGKVFLDIRSRPEKKPSFSASIIDYDGTFRLLPVKIKKSG